MRWTRIVAGVGSFGQALVVARIAGFGVVSTVPLLGAAVAGAVLLARTGPAAAWMIGWGGLGMTLGWWADLGFGTAADAVRHGGIDALWCHAALGSARSAVPGVGQLASWMNAGMLLFAIPAASRWMRPAALLRCTLGMALGMSAGSQLAAVVAARWAPAAAVIVDYAAMSAGMIAGMLALERARWRRVQMPRNAAIATSAQPPTVTRNPSAPA